MIHKKKKSLKLINQEHFEILQIDELKNINKIFSFDLKTKIKIIKFNETALKR